MESVLLDTDVFSYLLKKNDRRGDPYRAHVRGKTVAVSFVTVGELYFGSQKKGWGQAKLSELETLLRLPTGIFYAQGVKANVLFFDRKPAREKPWTERLWIYDLRTNLHFTLKENTLARSDLDDFVASYNPKNRHDRHERERFKGFRYEELAKRDKVNLDIFWLKDESLEESASLPAPDVIAAEIAADLEAALEQFAAIADDLKS